MQIRIAQYDPFCLAVLVRVPSQESSGYVHLGLCQTVVLQNLSKSVTLMDVLLIRVSPAVFFTAELGAGTSHILHMGLGFSFVCRPGIRMDSDGFGWIRMDSDGFGWIRMDSDGFGWIRMDSDGFGKLCLNPICQSQNCNWLRIARANWPSSEQKNMW